MVGENFEICISESARNTLKLSSMVGENFEICISEIIRNTLQYSPVVGEILKFLSLKWLEMH